ncbi:hypothetical protein [Companilactobacillus sp.]|uniref:hypothetical protein n=1 Tax=Companilactobacillus sp. TaxID=2767905 RepID=UPI0026174BD4|nr:hypothetical protein [Companilactobacillus sp.]
MKLKVGDSVVFKKYEYMTDEEQSGISKESFPKFGKVSEVYNTMKRFNIEGEPYSFSYGSIDYVIGDRNTDEINDGDEVLIKATVNNVLGDSVWLKPVIFKDDVVKVLKRKEERFIVKEDYYGMYIGLAQKLVGDKSKAKIYASRITANDKAADMHLNAWDVIPYEG